MDKGIGEHTILHIKIPTMTEVYGIKEEENK